MTEMVNSDEHGQEETKLGALRTDLSGWIDEIAAEVDNPLHIRLLNAAASASDSLEAMEAELAVIADELVDQDEN